MPLYTTLYTAHCIRLSSDNFRKGQLKTMNSETEHTVFENDMDWRKRKQRQLSETDDFQRTIFNRSD
jgi:hypothetical protein